MSGHRTARLLVYTHRWMGIALGVLFIVWFVSGIVMMYARMPELGTAERLGKIVILGAGEKIEAKQSAYCQVMLNEPLLALRGDHFIVRDETAQRTLAGGLVINPWAQRHKRGDRDLARVLVAPAAHGARREPKPVHGQPVAEPRAHAPRARDRAADPWRQGARRSAPDGGREVVEGRSETGPSKGRT